MWLGQRLAPKSKEKKITNKKWLDKNRITFRIRLFCINIVTALLKSIIFHAVVFFLDVFFSFEKKRKENHSIIRYWTIGENNGKFRQHQWTNQHNMKKNQTQKRNICDNTATQYYAWLDSTVGWSERRRKKHHAFIIDSIHTIFSFFLHFATFSVFFCPHQI